MHVLHATDVFCPRVGGIELHVRDTVAHQRAHGWDSRVWTPAPGPEAGPDPVPVLRTPLGRRTRAAVRARLRDDPPDVVHVHISIVSVFGPLVAREAAALGVPTLVTLHSVWRGYGPLPRALTRLLRVRGWPVVWSAVSRAAADSLERAVGGDVAAHVLPNALDVDAWKPPADGAGPGTGEPLRVVSVLRMTRTKRVLPLLHVLADVRRQVPASVPLAATVVGRGPQWGRARRAVRRLGLGDWVELTGQLDREQIRAHLERSALYLAPATKESFGLAPLEARCVGLPVVAREGTGVAEFVEHGRSGFLAADDDGLAAWTARLLADDDLRARVAEHNRDHRTSLTWEQAHRRTAELYERARTVAGRPPSLGSARAG